MSQPLSPISRWPNPVPQMASRVPIDKESQRSTSSRVCRQLTLNRIDTHVRRLEDRREQHEAFVSQMKQKFSLMENFSLVDSLDLNMGDKLRKSLRKSCADELRKSRVRMVEENLEYDNEEAAEEISDESMPTLMTPALAKNKTERRRDGDGDNKIMMDTEKSRGSSSTCSIVTPLWLRKKVRQSSCAGGSTTISRFDGFLHRQSTLLQQAPHVPLMTNTQDSRISGASSIVERIGCSPSPPKATTTTTTNASVSVLAPMRGDNNSREKLLQWSTAAHTISSTVIRRLHLQSATGGGYSTGPLKCTTNTGGSCAAVALKCTTTGGGNRGGGPPPKDTCVNQRPVDHQNSRRDCSTPNNESGTLKQLKPPLHHSPSRLTHHDEVLMGDISPVVVDADGDSSCHARLKEIGKADGSNEGDDQVRGGGGGNIRRREIHDGDLIVGTRGTPRSHGNGAGVERSGKEMLNNNANREETNISRKKELTGIPNISSAKLMIDPSFFCADRPNTIDNSKGRADIASWKNRPASVRTATTRCPSAGNLSSRPSVSSRPSSASASSSARDQKKQRVTTTTSSTGAATNHLPNARSAMIECGSDDYNRGTTATRMRPPRPQSASATGRRRVVVTMASAGGAGGAASAPKTGYMPPPWSSSTSTAAASTAAASAGGHGRCGNGQRRKNPSLVTGTELYAGGPQQERGPQKEELMNKKERGPQEENDDNDGDGKEELSTKNHHHAAGPRCVQKSQRAENEGAEREENPRCANKRIRSRPGGPQDTARLTARPASAGCTTTAVNRCTLTDSGLCTDPRAESSNELPRPRNCNKKNTHNPYIKEPKKRPSADKDKENHHRPGSGATLHSGTSGNLDIISSSSHTKTKQQTTNRRPVTAKERGGGGTSTKPMNSMAAPEAKSAARICSNPSKVDKKWYLDEEMIELNEEERRLQKSLLRLDFVEMEQAKEGGKDLGQFANQNPLGLAITDDLVYGNETEDALVRGLHKLDRLLHVHNRIIHID